MTTEATTYTMLGRRGEKYEVSGAVEVAPGLYVFRLPHGLALNNPARWNIGHHSGYCVAEAMRREDALKGAELLASLHDWTKDVAFLKEEVDERALLLKLRRLNCSPVDSQYMRGDVSNNGTYTDADVEQAAAEFAEEAFSAMEILVSMNARVPWMGLDTEDFNEAHDRIVRAAGAE